MSNAIETLDGPRGERSRIAARPSPRLFGRMALIAAAAWAAAAIITVALARCRSVGQRQLFAGIMGGGAAVLGVLAFLAPRLGRFGHGFDSLRPVADRDRRLVCALGADDGEVRLAAEAVLLAAERAPERLCHRGAAASHLHRVHAPSVGVGFVCGVAVGYAIGVALGWSKRFAYWGMPILKLIGPVPATAWIPCHILFLSDDVRRERLHRGAGVREFRW